MTYEANQTVYHMGQGVAFLSYIGEDRALVEVDVYDRQRDRRDEYDGENSIYSHSVTVLVDVGALTDKKDDLWPIAKAELAKHERTLAAATRQINEARIEQNELHASIRKLEAEAKKYEALDTIFREINGEATHYIYCYGFWGNPEVIAPGQYCTREIGADVRIAKSGGQWKIDRGHFKDGDSYYVPCFGEDDLKAKLIVFCERRINQGSLSFDMEKFCTEHHVTSEKITAAIQKRKDVREKKIKKRIAKAKAELAKLEPETETIGQMQDAEALPEQTQEK